MYSANFAINGFIQPAFNFRKKRHYKKNTIVYNVKRRKKSESVEIMINIYFYGQQSNRNNHTYSFFIFEFPFCNLFCNFFNCLSCAGLRVLSLYSNASLSIIIAFRLLTLLNKNKKNGSLTLHFLFKNKD